jgi:hypothetical protein
MWGKHPPGLFRSSNPNSQPQLHGFGLHRVGRAERCRPQHLPSINHATDRLDPRVIRTPSHHAKLRPCGSQSVWAGLLFISGVGRQYSRCGNERRKVRPSLSSTMAPRQAFDVSPSLQPMRAASSGQWRRDDRKG